MKNKKTVSLIVFIIGVVALIIATGILIYNLKQRQGSAKGACSMEARICSDGSESVRTGPNCEFTPCGGEGSLIGPRD